MKKLLPLILLLCACKGPPGRDGEDGRNGSTGSTGNPGSTGPGGVNTGGTLFTYSGTVPFPSDTATQQVVGLSLERGDVLNVYLRWHNGEEKWSQIGANWVGGASGWYTVQNDQVVITIVTGLDTDWLISGLLK